MRDKEVNVSETDTNVSLAANMQLGRKKKARKKRERKNGIIKFSFVLTGVILFCRGIKWNGEVKKRKKRNNKPKRNHSLVRLMLLFYLGL